MNQIVAVASYPAGGKSVFTDVARDMGYERVEMGSVVRKHANREWSDQVRDARQPDTAKLASEVYGEFVTDKRAEHGMGIVARWCESAVKNSDGPVVVDGIRSPEERQQFESYATVDVVYIHTPASLRLERIQQRGRDGEDSFGAAELIDRDTRENGFGLNQLIADADYTIHNTVDIGRFNNRSQGLLRSLLR